MIVESPGHPGHYFSFLLFVFISLHFLLQVSLYPQLTADVF